MAILFCIVVPPLGLFQLLLLSITPSPKELARREAAQRHAASPPSVLTPTSRAIFAASGLTDEQIESLFANGLSRELCATNFDSMLAGGWSIEQTAKFVADSYATGVRRAHDRLR